MELVAMEAEQCSGFYQETVKLARKISDEATSALMRLNDVTEVTSREIEAALSKRH